jgi:hypothetical protein
VLKMKLYACIQTCRHYVYSQMCRWGHLYWAVTCIKRSPFSFPVIENFIWIEPLLGDLLIQVWLYVTKYIGIFFIKRKVWINTYLSYTFFVLLNVTQLIKYNEKTRLIRWYCLIMKCLTSLSAIFEAYRSG